MSVMFKEIATTKKFNSQPNQERTNQMPIIKQTESSYTPAPEGTHPARCYSMISLGTQVSANPQFKPSFQVVVGFELPNEAIEINGEKKPMAVSQFLNAYLGSPKKPSKTNLFLTAWRGRAFTESELAGFDLSKVVGASCLLNIIHEVKDGKTREKIASISPLPKGMTMPPAQNKPIIYEVEQGRDAMFQKLPEWTQNLISKCIEWNSPAIAAEAHTEEETSEDVPF